MTNQAEINWDRIEDFIGYGRRDAPVVFIGMEEGLRCENALHKDLAIRSDYEQVMDLERAHRGIAHTERFFDPDCVVSQRTWRPMCDLMLRREGVAAPTLEQRSEYQALRLGRSDGDTLLAELLPYPHKKAAGFLYAQFGRYPTRKAYMKELLPKRKRLLRGVLAESHRQLVVCYGKAHWPHYQDQNQDRKIFDGATWSDSGPFRIAEIGGTRIVLARHFSHRGFNTAEQLGSLARVALVR